MGRLPSTFQPMVFHRGKEPSCLLFQTPVKTTILERVVLLVYQYMACASGHGNDIKLNGLVGPYLTSCTYSGTGFSIKFLLGRILQGRKNVARRIHSQKGSRTVQGEASFFPHLNTDKGTDTVVILSYTDCM